MLEPGKQPYVSKSMYSMKDIVDISGTARYPLAKIHGQYLSLASFTASFPTSMLVRYPLAKLHGQCISTTMLLLLLLIPTFVSG